MSSSFIGGSSSFGGRSHATSYSGPVIPKLKWKDCHTWDLKVGFVFGEVAKGIPTVLGMVWDGTICVTKLLIINPLTRACYDIFCKVFASAGRSLAHLWNNAINGLNDLYMSSPILACRAFFSSIANSISTSCAAAAACFSRVCSSIADTASAFYALISPYLTISDEFKRSCNAVGIAVLVGLSRALQAARDGIGSLYNRISPYLPSGNDILQSCVNACRPVWEAAINGITRFFNSIDAGLASLRNRYITPIVPYIESCLNACSEKLNAIGIAIFDYVLSPIQNWGISPLFTYVLSPISTVISNITKAFFSACCRTRGNTYGIDDDERAPLTVSLDEPLVITDADDYFRLCRHYGFKIRGHNAPTPDISVRGDWKTLTWNNLRSTLEGEEDYTFTVVESYETVVAEADYRCVVTKHLKAE